MSGIIVFLLLLIVIVASLAVFTVPTQLVLLLLGRTASLPGVAGWMGLTLIMSWLLGGPVFIILGWSRVMLSALDLAKNRQYAWALRLFHLQRRRELEDEGRRLGADIADRLRVSVERLRRVYQTERLKTNQAKADYQQALWHLQHLGEQPDMDPQTLKSVSWLVEFTLDQRRQADIVSQSKAASLNTGMTC